MRPDSIDEATQPIKANAKSRSEEDTSQTKIEKINQPTDETKIPGWLLEFASQSEQDGEVQSDHGLEAIQEPDLGQTDAETPFILETSEWHEVQGELETPVECNEVPSDGGEQDQELSRLLAHSDFAAAADFIRKTAIGKKIAEDYQHQLRPYLILQEDRSALWKVYTELSEFIFEENQNQLNGG
ncbi:MAG: hypothetical protein AAGU15_10405 [Anaerolineaceae bacterium]|jgi:hypothetical protein